MTRPGSAIWHGSGTRSRRPLNGHWFSVNYKIKSYVNCLLEVQYFSTRFYGTPSMNVQMLMHEALKEARSGLEEGGLPIGSVLSDEHGGIVARGHNLRMQTGDPTAHAEVVCVRNAGRRRDWHRLTLVSTLSPCIMCTGTSLLYRIPRVVIGENQNFLGAEDLFRQRGVEVTVLQDPDCIQMMRNFIREHPDLWNEDIGK